MKKVPQGDASCDRALIEKWAAEFLNVGQHPRVRPGQQMPPHHLALARATAAPTSVFATGSARGDTTKQRGNFSKLLRAVPNGLCALCCTLLWNVGFGCAFHHLEGWTAWESFIFACALVSTIGYGNIVPKSDAGKACVIVCGLFIPVFAFSVLWIGAVMQQGMDALLMRAALCCGRGTISGGVRKLVYVLLLVLYFVQAVAVYVLMEEWRVIDAAYYVFCVFTTIGLGDFVPVSTGGYRELRPLTWYHVWHFAVVIIGLAIIGIALNGAFEQVRQHALDGAKETAKRVKRRLASATRVQAIVRGRLARRTLRSAHPSLHHSLTC